MKIAKITLFSRQNHVTEVFFGYIFACKINRGNKYAKYNCILQTESAFCILSLSELTILAENLKFIRRRNNLSQTKFGEQHGLNRGNIDSYEKGTEPRLKVLIDIAETNKVNLMHMLTAKMTHDNFHLFAADVHIAANMVKDSEGVYGDSEIYSLLREMEETNDTEEKRKLSKEITKLVGRIMNENTSLRKELMEAMKKIDK